MSEPTTIRPVRDVCISSADSTYVFGPAGPGEWLVSDESAGWITCECGRELADELQPTSELAEPAVHITFDSDGDMFHGRVLIRQVSPELKLEVAERLTPA